MQLTKVEMEMKGLQENFFESLCDSIFDMEEKLLQLRQEIKETFSLGNKHTYSYERMVCQKVHLMKKIARAQASMESLRKQLKLEDVVDSSDADSCV